MTGKEKLTQEFIKKLQDNIDDYIQKAEKPNLNFLFEELLNYIMERERLEYLKKHPFDFANGFYSRKLNINLGTLGVKVPRVRFGNTFRPKILPERWKRVDKDYEEFLIALLSNGYSKSRIKKTVQKAGLPFSEDSLENVEELIYEKLSYFKIRPLEPDWFAVFIDAYHCELKNDSKMSKFSIFTAVGIDLDGYKHILGYWIQSGKENSSLWKNIFQDLISRGLSKVLVFITDNFPGIESLIKKFFPLSDHQLCFVHFLRNLKRNLDKKSSKKISNFWKKIKMADNFDEGEKIYNELLDFVKIEKPAYSKLLEKLKNNYLNFLKYPEDVRKFIYTTNIVESINSGIEKMRYDLGGYFASVKSLETNLFIQLINLHDNWIRKPVPALKGNSYRLRQLFNLKFDLQDTIINIHNF